METAVSTLTQTADFMGKLDGILNKFIDAGFLVEHRNLFVELVQLLPQMLALRGVAAGIEILLQRRLPPAQNITQLAKLFGSRRIIQRIVEGVFEFDLSPYLVFG